MQFTDHRSTLRRAGRHVYRVVSVGYMRGVRPRVEKQLIVGTKLTLIIKDTVKLGSYLVLIARLWNFSY